MEKSLSEVIKHIQNALNSDIENGDKQTLKLIVNAHNAGQLADSRLYDVTDSEDLKACIDNGMNARQISEAYNEYADSEGLSRFRYAHYNNGEYNFTIYTDGKLRDYLRSVCFEDADYIIACPFKNEALKELYQRYVTDYMIAHNMF